MKKGDLLYRGKKVETLSKDELIEALYQSAAFQDSLLKRYKKAENFNIDLMGHIANANPVR